MSLLYISIQSYSSVADNTCLKGRGMLSPNIDLPIMSFHSPLPLAPSHLSSTHHPPDLSSIPPSCLTQSLPAMCLPLHATSTCVSSSQSPPRPLHLPPGHRSITIPCPSPHQIHIHDCLSHPCKHPTHL
jgi:hypothetical protein